MLLKDSFTINAPLDAVWAFLSDVPQIATCVPGISGIQQVGDNTYQGKFEVRVGPIGTAFDGKATFTERIEREKLVALIEGQDKTSATFVSATFTGMLAPLEGQTQLDYDVDVALRGRLAQFGVAVVKATAKKLTGQFAKCLEAKLSESTSTATSSE